MLKSIRMGMLVGLMALSGAGTTVVAPTPAVAQGLEYSAALGVLVQHSGAGMLVRVVRGGVARQLGLQPGDLIFAINGNHPDSLSDLANALFAGADNEDHDMDVIRSGQHLHALLFHVHGQVYMHGTGLH